MNAIVIRLEISRHNSESCRVRVVREGSGDDIVEARSDFIQILVSQALKEMLELEQMLAEKRKL